VGTIYKLQIAATVVDDLVSVDELTEKIQEWEDVVQSVDVTHFVKI
jgi:translation elongation factor EF-1beta